MLYRIFSVYLLTLAYLNGANAQWYAPEKVKKDVRALYDASYQAIVAGDEKNALALLDKSLQKEPRFVEGYIAKGGILNKMRQYADALLAYKSAMQLDAQFAQSQAVNFAVAYAGIGAFDSSLSILDNYLAMPNISARNRESALARKTQFSFAAEHLMKHPNRATPFKPVLLGEGVNTKSLEYYPSFSIDSRTIIFTRRTGSQEDFFVSRMNDERWSPAVRLSDAINTPNNEGAQNISADGSLLVFAGCDYPQGWGSCDLYESQRTENGWSAPQNLGSNINTDFWESAPTISPDKRELYFVSNRPGGYGGKDIYVSKKDSSGHWQKPINLGSAINTKSDDESPFLHSDNETLYFTSNGHPGYGNRDIFFAKRQANGGWDSVQNLGYPINTIDDEGALVVAADGKTAFFATDKFGNGNNLDIATFQLEKHLQASPTTWVTGFVYDKKTNQRLATKIELQNISTNSLASSINTNDQGEFLATLPAGRNYAFNVYKKGYVFFSQQFHTDSLNNHAPDTINIPMSPIEKGVSIVLNNIFFETNKAELLPTSAFELDKVVLLLKDNPLLKIGIYGHTDNVGKPAANLLLSNSRAKSVKDFLLEKGIAATRIVNKGFGETKPVASNNTEEGRAKNRRTEMVVL